MNLSSIRNILLLKFPLPSIFPLLASVGWFKTKQEPSTFYNVQFSPQSAIKSKVSDDLSPEFNQQ